MFWYDGELVESDRLALKIDDPGLLYGGTVFTTLRVYYRSLAHPLTHWQEHCDRLHSSLQAFDWMFPDWQRLRKGAEILLDRHPVLRIAIFADGREWITGRMLPEDLQQRQQQGVVGWVADEALFQRSLAHHKTGNYLGAWLALQKAFKNGAKEAILVNSQGCWLETSTGNLWGWKDGCWYTPSLSEGILPGIGRSNLLRWLNAQQIPVKENRWTPEFIQDLKAIAYSNSVVEIVPFSSIIYQQQQLTFNPHHPVLKQLQSYFKG